MYAPGVPVDYYDSPITPQRYDRTNYDALFLRATPPRLYQLETTRSLTVRVSVLCALASFLATGYVAFCFRASPQVIQRVFFTTLGLGVFFSGTAALLSSLPPHPNDPVQRQTLIAQFSARWPYISSDQLLKEYGSLIDLSSMSQILNAQFAEFKSRLAPLSPQLTKESNPDLRSLEQEIHTGPAFDNLCNWHSPETLAQFSIKEPTNQHAFMAALWTPRVGSTFEQRCQEFSPLLSMRTLSTNAIFQHYLPLFRDRFSRVLLRADEEATQQAQILPSLSYYEGRVFQDLSPELKDQLLLVLKRWIYPIWKAEVFPSATPDTPLRKSRPPEVQSTAGSVYAILKGVAPSTSFSFMSDIFLPLLIKANTEDSYSWDAIVPQIPAGLNQQFWELFAKRCPAAEPSATCVQNVINALAASPTEDQQILIDLLKDRSADWKTALTPGIKQLLVNAHERSSGRLAPQSAFPITNPLEDLLSEADRTSLGQLRKFLPDATGYEAALKTFLVPSCDA